MNIKLILICKDGEARQAYLNEAKAIGVQFDVVSTYDELFKYMLNNPYHGILIDLPTNIKTSKEEKAAAQEAIRSFPIAQLNWERESGSIRTISFGKTLTSCTLHDFINDECQPFTARSIRLHARKNINFNILLAREEGMSEAFLERTVTVNVSKGGCFLFSGQDWSNILHVSFVINELQDKSPIVGEIRWSIEWGETMTIPGIGICFKHIKQGQLDELSEKFLNLKKS